MFQYLVGGAHGRESTSTYCLVISGIPVQVFRKKIKHLYIKVVPPEGEVRVSAPLGMSKDAVRGAVSSRLEWIRRRQQRLAAVPESRSEHNIVSGERHYFQGEPYTLNVVEHRGPAAVRAAGNATLEMKVRPGTGRSKRKAVLEQWYRQCLSEEIPGLIRRWEPVMGVQVAEWRIKRMRTRWGTCNIRDRRIWMNLELARKSPECLEYVLVHEMVHLMERRHNARFRAYMDQFLPRWRVYRERLHREPAERDPR